MQVAEVIELNIDGVIVEVERLEDGMFRKPAYLAGAERETVGLKLYGDGQTYNGGERSGRSGGGIMGTPVLRGPNMETAPATPDAATWAGWGTALKPAWEPVILAMKPLEGTFAENALTWGVAGLNVDGARIPTDELLLCHDGQNKNANTYGGGWNNYELGSGRQYRTGGRWPANLLLDEDAAAALDAQSGVSKSTGGITNRSREGTLSWHRDDLRMTGNRGGLGDTGGASRFFYVAKASRAERNAGLEGMEARYQLRNDLTPEQRAYVMGELQRLGIA